MSLMSEGTPEPVAFEQLVNEYGDRVYSIALRITGSPSDAEEVMQETFLLAFRSWPDFRGEAAPTTWLYRIAVNTALMKIRGRPTELLTEHPDTLETADWSTDAAQEALREELNQQLGDGISRLPEELRAVLILRDVEGLSTAETSAALDLTEAAVKSRLHRARVLLRRHLSAMFGNDG
ncbi:MAG: RNA polymerase sigma factor [Chloroflexota bacterium]